MVVLYYGQELAIKSIKQKSDRALTGAMELLVACEVQKNVVNYHLASLIGWYLHHGSLRIVTEYMLRGTLLEHLLQTKSPDYPHKKFRRIIRRIASGLSPLEFKRIEPRDLAAQSIYLDQSNSVRVSNSIVYLINTSRKSKISKRFSLIF